MDIASGLRALPIVLLFALAPAGVLAQSAPPAQIEISGVSSKGPITVEQMEALPQVEQEVTFNTSKGVSTAKYKGPLLWEVVKATKAIDGLERNKELEKTLLVTASDGYKIAFSIGEIAPEFGNATILLALETDGEKLKDGIRVVAQGDKRGARAIHNVVSIEVR